jgi:hypothetical protein
VKIKQVFCKDLEDAVMSYHEGHRDTGVKLVKFVCSPMGEPLILVRCVDEYSHKISILTSFFYDAVYRRWDISDLYWSLREDESELLESYMQGVNKNTALSADRR